MAFIVAMSTAALAAEQASSTTAPVAGKIAKGQPGEKFEQRKSRILERLGKRAAAIQKKQTCVQAATNPESLKACFPRMEQRSERKEGDQGTEQ